MKLNYLIRLLFVFVLLLVSSVYAATYTITVNLFSSKTTCWRNDVVMNSSNKIQNVIAIDDNVFNPPTTNAINNYLDNEELSTHPSAAIAVGWQNANFQQALLNIGGLMTVISRDDMVAGVDGGVRFFSAYTIPEAAYYSMATSGLMKTTSPDTINDTGNSFKCDKVNPSYHIPTFSITTPDLDDSLTLSGTVLSQTDSNDNTNTLDDSVIRIRWRNLTTGAAWENDNPACTDGAWTFSILESDFDTSESNQFEAYAYAVSERTFFPMSDLGSTVWLKKPASPQGPYINVTSPANWTEFPTATYIIVTGVATDDVSVASVTIGGVNVDTFSGPGQSCTWGNQLSLVEGTNSFTFMATDDESLTDTITVNYVVPYKSLVNPYINVTSPTNWTEFPTATNIIVTGVATDDVSVASVTIDGVNVDTFSGPGQSCTWGNQLSLVEGTNSFTFMATDDESLTDTITVNYVVPTAPPQPDYPFLMVTNPANWSVFYDAQQIEITGIATDNVAIVNLTRNGTDITAHYSAPGFIDSQFMGLGTNIYVYIARDVDGNAATDTVNYVVKVSPPTLPYINVDAPISGSIYQYPTNLIVTGVATDNFEVVSINRNGIDLGITKSQEVLWTNSISEILMPKGTNIFNYVATDNDGNSATDSVVYIVLKDAIGNTNPYERVLCIWPQYIGASQTGSVEFLSKYACNWYLDAASATGTVTVAQGFCTSGWNLVPFAAAKLPNQLVSGVSNALSFRLDYSTKSVTNDAGTVTVVEDLAYDPTNSKLFTEDFDGDSIYIKYKSKTDGKLDIKGRTIYIKGGSKFDKIMIKVKPAKQKTGDGTARICGIISDAGLKMIKSFASVDMVQADENVEKILLKGTLGFPSDSWRYHVRFPAPMIKYRSKIMTKIVKSKKTKQFMPETGNIYASILIGKLKNDVKAGQFETDPFSLSNLEELGGLIMIYANGGDIGINEDTADKYNVKYTKRRLTAGCVKKVTAKPKKIVGGKIADYSFYLDNEFKPGKLISCIKMLAYDFVDSSDGNSNMVFVMGYDSANIKSPSTITNWIGQNVKYNLKKFLIKSGQLKGTVVIKGPVDKKKQIKGIDEATWIVDGKLE